MSIIRKSQHKLVKDAIYPNIDLPYTVIGFFQGLQATLTMLLSFLNIHKPAISKRIPASEPTSSIYDYGYKYIIIYIYTYNTSIKYK